MTVRPTAIKVKTGFRAIGEPNGPNTRSIYSFLEVLDMKTGSPAFYPDAEDKDKNNALFLYKAPDTGDTSFSVNECEYKGIVHPEQLYLKYTEPIDNAIPALFWDNLPVAEPVYDPDSESSPENINDATITGSAVQASFGWFRSSVKVVEDIAPGITTDRAETNEKLKNFIDEYKKTRAMTTCMDTDKYPEGYEDKVIGSDNFKIKLQILAKSEKQSEAPKDTEYQVIVFVKDIVNRNNVSIEGLPRNMFLMVKVNNTNNTAERVEESKYLRVVDPQDIQKANPTTFGACNPPQIWGRDGETLSPDAPTQPLAEATYNNMVITNLTGATQAKSPSVTNNNTGYYKSKVYKLATKDVTEAATSRNFIVSAITAFVTKYEAYKKEATGLGYDSFESEDFA